MYADNLDQVEIGTNTMDKLSGMTYYIGEFPSSYYTDAIQNTYDSYHDAAIVVFGRQGGEGMDFGTDLKASLTNCETAMSSSVAETKNYADGQHQLKLSAEEKELLAHVEEHFDKVIVLINSSNVMELGELKDDEKVDIHSIIAILIITEFTISLAENGNWQTGLEIYKIYQVER